MRRGSRRTQQGFTYVMVLIAMIALGVALSVTGPWWSQELQRARERELIRVGTAYLQAIESYYRSSPGAEPRLPKEIDDLLADDRFVTMRRHLRQAYVDPMTSRSDWKIVRDPAGRVVGLHSSSERATLAERVQLPDGRTIVGNRYSEWRFVYDPRRCAAR